MSMPRAKCSTDVPDAAYRYAVHAAAENLHSLYTAVHVKVVVGKHHIGTCLNLHAPGIPLRGDNDIVILDKGVQFWISKAEVLGSAEEDAPLAYPIARLIQQLVGIVGVISAVIREVLLRQPDGGRSCLPR